MLLVCSYCQRIVGPQAMMGRVVQNDVGRYKAVRHGPRGCRCRGSGQFMESAANVRLTEAQRQQVEAHAARLRRGAEVHTARLRRGAEVHAELVHATGALDALRAFVDALLARDVEQFEGLRRDLDDDLDPSDAERLNALAESLDLPVTRFETCEGDFDG